jgi:hypothetical protein
LPLSLFFFCIKFVFKLVGFDKESRLFGVHIIKGIRVKIRKQESIKLRIVHKTRLYNDKLARFIY